ncbi:MAG TPA: redoxin domain-containing protein [Bryobacteraceae bacterium]|nr:redoxin domain-containing protein [Bryobacteraceae bacterium]
MKLVALLFAFVLLAPAQFNYRRAPGFALPDMQQKWHDIADYRGKVVVLDIMRTDCPHCKTITSTLEQVKTKYAGKLQILSVITMPDNMNSVQAYAKANKVTVPMLFDCGQMIASYLKLGPQNPTVDLPTVYVIDRNGMIRTELKGEAATPPAILGAIEAALQ